MKIVLTHAYFLDLDPKERHIMKPYPPLGLLYISAWLEKYGFANEVYDSTFSSPQRQRQYLTEAQPDMIAIYANLMTKVKLAELISFIRSENLFNQTLIVLGGPDVTNNIENYLSLGADVLVVGEGEETMLELAMAYKDKSKAQLHQIDGIAFIDDSRGVVTTKARQKMQDLDALPLPNRGKIDMSLYLDTWKNFHGKSSMSISTQRGCPYTCKWCSTPVFGQSHRRRSPIAVVQELEIIQKEYHPDQLWFVDDVFTISHKWLNEFHEELKKRNLIMPFECITRADRLTEEVLKVLKDTGCFRVWIGAESGSQTILDAMDRKVNIDQVNKLIVYAKKIGIESGTFIMLGYPGETEEDIHLTLKHLKSANPDYFTITLAYPIKGTPLYKETEATQIKLSTWAKTTDHDIDFKRSFPRFYYFFAIRWVVNGVKLHKLQSAQGAFGLSGWMSRFKIILARLGMFLTKSKIFNFS